MSKNYLLPTNIIVSLDPCPLSPLFWCFRAGFCDLLLSKPCELPTGAFFQSRNSGESVPCRDKWSKRTGRSLAEYPPHLLPFVCYWRSKCILCSLEINTSKPFWAQDRDYPKRLSNLHFWDKTFVNINRKKKPWEKWLPYISDGLSCPSLFSLLVFFGYILSWIKQEDLALVILYIKKFLHL